MQLNTPPTPDELKSARKEANMSLRDLADKTSVSHVAISKIEKGENDPRLSTVMQMVVAINDEL